MKRVLSSRARILIVSSVCLSMLLVMTSHLLAYTVSACNAECESVSCGGYLVMKKDGSTYKGCSEKWIGDNCTGECYECTGGTVDSHCVSAEDKTCYAQTGSPSTSCGGTTYYPCQGDHYPSCSYDKNNGRQEPNTPCSRVKCDIDG
jgi:hypothetical protein